MLDNRKKLYVLSFILLLAALACGQLDIGILSSDPTPTLFQPTFPAPTDFTPTRTPYFPPDSEEKPTPTPYFPLDVPGSLNEIGPWLVFVTGKTDGDILDNQLWAVNPDGTGLTQLAGDFYSNRSRSQDYLKPVVSPYGGHIAYLSIRPDGLTPELHIVSLPSQEDQTVTTLFDPDALQDYPATVEVIYKQAPSLAWSPDGNQLAFIGALDGETADLYLYDLAQDAITRLSDGPGQAYRPVWSQDGEWIMHTATSDFPQSEGFSSSLFVSDGLWAARPDGSEIVELAGPAEEAKLLKYAPWYGSRFIFSAYDSLCGEANNCWQDIVSGEGGAFPFPVMEYAIDPTVDGLSPGGSRDGDLLTAGLEGPAAAVPASTYYFTLSQPEGLRVTGDLTSLQWVPGAEFFAGKSEEVPYLQAVLIAGGGILQTVNWRNIQPDYMRLAVAPNGRSLAWFRSNYETDTGLWLGDTSSQNLKRVFSGPVTDLRWNANSSGVFFIHNKFNTASAGYTEGLHYMPSDGSFLQGVKEFGDDEFLLILDWCRN